MAASLSTYEGMTDPAEETIRIMRQSEQRYGGIIQRRNPAMPPNAFAGKAHKRAHAAVMSRRAGRVCRQLLEYIPIPAPMPLDNFRAAWPRLRVCRQPETDRRALRMLLWAHMRPRNDLGLFTNQYRAPHSSRWAIDTSCRGIFQAAHPSTNSGVLC